MTKQSDMTDIPEAIGILLVIAGKIKSCLIYREVNENNIHNLYSKSFKKGF